MPKPLRATFRSYLSSLKSQSLTGSSSSINSIPPDNPTVEPQLLPGELVVAYTDSVIRFIPYSEQSSGQAGHLFVTNFKLSFLTYDINPQPASGNSWQGNKLYCEEDVVLANVLAIYHIYKGKRKKLIPGTGVSSSVKSVEIHCKDFRVHNFCFKAVPKEDSKRVINALVHHAFPVKQNLLFAFEMKRTSGNQDDLIPKYNSRFDWQALLNRLHANHSFYVCDFNQNFEHSPTLPENFVVPKQLTNQMLRNKASQFTNDRCPVWSYSHPNGAALVRMACVIPTSLEGDKVQELMKKAVAEAHPLKRAPKMCPLQEVTARDIMTSYEKLLSLIMPVSMKDVEDTDCSWLSLLDQSSWLQYVAHFLKLALSVADCLDRRNTSIILLEDDGRDMSPLVSCLVQLLLDPYTRTLHGLQDMIEREWVALGHCFFNAMAFVFTDDAMPCPVFLLFLDCVWQLLQQFPSAFQFSEMYLTSLWDSACLGLFDNFIFNCMRERRRVVQDRGFYSAGVDPAISMSVWDWNQQFTSDHQSLFNNPLYRTRTELNLNANHKRQSRMGINTLKYSLKLSDTFLYDPEIKTTVLRPVVCPQRIKLWSHCYLRWLTPVQIMSGGSPSEYLQQCLLVEEILQLNTKIAALEKSPASMRPKSHLIFEGVTDRKSEAKSRWSGTVTSSFPFSPRRSSAHVSFFETTVSQYLTDTLVDLPECDSVSMESLECSLDDSQNFYKIAEPNYISQPKSGPILVNSSEKIGSGERTTAGDRLSGVYRHASSETENWKRKDTPDKTTEDFSAIGMSNKVPEIVFTSDTSDQASDKISEDLSSLGTSDTVSDKAEFSSEGTLNAAQGGSDST